MAEPLTLPTSTPTKRTSCLWAWVQRLAGALLTIYAGGLLFGVALSRLAPDLWWPLALFPEMLPWPFFALVVALPLALLLRYVPAIATNGAAALLFVVLWGGLFVPSLRPSPQGTPLRVLTFNMQGSNTRDEEVIALVRGNNPDIIALQEVSATVAVALAEAFPEYTLITANEGINVRGIGVMCRCEILETELLDDVPNRLPHLRAVIEIDGQQMTVYSAHPLPPGFRWGGVLPTYDASRRTVQIIDLMDYIEEERGPVLLLGDFNTTDQTQDYRRVRAVGFTDAWRQSGTGFGFTFPEGGALRGLALPRLIRIDYVWLSAEFTAVDAWVGPAIGSDHRPVLADLVWATEGSPQESR